MKRSIKGILSVCVAMTAFYAVSVSADIQTTDRSKAREGNILVEVPGIFSNKDHEDVLYRLNLIRYTACREGDPEVNDKNSGPTGKKLKLATDWGAAPTKDQLKKSNGDYVPFEWSAELEKMSEIRSVEGMLYLDNHRPNANNEGAINMVVNGYGFEALECVAWNADKSYKTALKIIEEERAAWIRQTPNAVTGDYTNLISMNRTYVGVSNFRFDVDAEGNKLVFNMGNYVLDWGATAFETAETPRAGKTYPIDFDQILRSTNPVSYSMTKTPRALTGKHTQLVEVAEEHAQGLKIKGKDHIQKGEETELTPIVQLKTLGGCVPAYSSGSWKVHSGTQWSSSDTNVATVDQNGVVTGISNGTVTITAKLGSRTARFTISVKALKGLEAPEDIKVASGTDIKDIKLPETVKGFWDDNKNSDEKVIWDTADLTQTALDSREGVTIALRGKAADREVVQVIKVEPARALDIEFEKFISTKSGTAPVLPKTAKISWSNGEVTESVISWDKLTADDYTSRIGKTTSLKGTVDGQDIAVSITVIRPVLVKIDWISEPTKKVYQEGESLNVDGGKILLTYDDGYSYEVTLTENLVEGFSDKPGIHTLSISYEKQTITYDIRVDAKAVSTTAPAAEPPKSDELVISGSSYKLSGNTAVYTWSANKASITVRDSIKVNGKVYKVTVIADSAFMNNPSVKKVVIGKNVTSIKANAFKGCKNLKNITVKTTKLKASKVGKNAFKGINKKAVFKLPKKKFKTYKAIFKKSAKSSGIKYKKL